MISYADQIILSNEGSLTGKLLIAMPHYTDKDFQKTIVYVCAHNHQEVTGLVINRILDGLTLNDLLQQVDITPNMHFQDQLVCYGGPMDIRHGLILHSLDYQNASTDSLNKSFGVTATLEILKAIANGYGPKHKLVMLGYSSWKTSYIEQEILNHNWLVAEPDEEMIFDIPMDIKWKSSFMQIGVNSSYLSIEHGHA